MKYLVIGDLHGAIPHIHKKIIKGGFGAIICVGDFCSDKGSMKYFKKFYKKFAKGKKSQLWWEMIGKGNAKKILINQMDAGRKVLAKLDKIGVPVYVIPGNWDNLPDKRWGWSFLEKNHWKEYILKDFKNIIDVDGKVKIAGEHIIIGYGKVNGPELLKNRGYENVTEKAYKKNEQDFKKLIVKYDKLFKIAKKKGKPIIFLSHNAPFNTKLDKISNLNSLFDGCHYGSNLVRKMIEKYQPQLNIAGHMHEHFGKCNIKGTICINAGFKGWVNTYIDLDNNKLRKLEFIDPKKQYKNSKIKSSLKR